MSASSTHPRLRPLDIRPVTHSGRPMLYLRDPLGLSEGQVLVPQALGPALSLCDGARDLAAIQAELLARFGLRVSVEVLRQLVAALDQGCLLEGPPAEAALARALAAYRAAPYRPPSLADAGYPADPAALHSLLARYYAAAERLVEPAPAAALRGLISPHIDYARGGPVYATAWRAASAAVAEAELVVVFGTDHTGGLGRLTLTRQSYATPFGILPTDLPAVEALAAALGEEAAFAEELHHRQEHSIELAAIWLGWLRRERPVALLPILCGSFAHFIAGVADPASDPDIAALLAALAQVTAGRRTLIVAAADLAHVGPAFGGSPVDAIGRARLRANDEGMLAHVAAGDAASFFAALRALGDRDNVCGLPPIYLTLRALAPVTGRLTAYDRCPADERSTSWVTVCGMTFAG
jgi:hypothetical protein